MGTTIRKMTGLLAALSFGVAMMSSVQAADAPQTITLTSPAFEHESDIPLMYSAYGDNISPELSWSNLPEGTKQLALIMDDPVVPMPQPFVHWVAYNIPASATGLPSAMPTDAMVANPDLKGMINGHSGLRRPGYFGPRPPADGKVHLYTFKLYALDSELNLAEGLNKDALLEAIDGHVLAMGVLVGHYQQQE
ncbi:MAG: YbhB/YbcL family Raf kinase inhibitor-like protein [Pseudohongiellaceae bacterium]|nr:YbhB/YbcL family Raf kinase inhibitor-like protein [Pseudohongiellaceae bacterium]